MPPFFTWSFSMASAAVVPGAPALSRPMASRISATESPMAGVGARERSMMPKGTFRRRDASLATSCPTLVILKAVFLMVSESSSKFMPAACFSASRTTPGPETPRFSTQSASETPWKAPAIKGLSSGALQNTTSLEQALLSVSLVRYAASLITSPMSRTASMLMPVLVDARLTEAQTILVSASARGRERISSSSAVLMPFWQMAEKPPRKLTPTAAAALSRVCATFT